MAEKESLDDLEDRWEQEEVTVHEMIEQLFLHMKDHQQLFARQQAGMLASESRFRKLEERLEAFEQWMATAGEQLTAIWKRLTGRE